MNMFTSSTTRVPLPHRCPMLEASTLAILCLLKAAAIENPPSRSIITWENIDENTCSDAARASKRWPSTTMTRRTTARKGTSMAVTNRANVSAAHRTETKTRSARAFRFVGSSSKTPGLNSSKRNTSRPTKPMCIESGSCIIWNHKVSFDRSISFLKLMAEV